jgi:hypothetical protein
LADNTDEFSLNLESDANQTHGAEDGEELAYFMVLEEISS